MTPKPRTRAPKVKRDCCPLMTFVLDRRRENDRLGMMAETMWSLSGMTKPRDTVVIRFNKAPRGDKSEGANATYAEINFCPFCGKPRSKR